MAWGPVVLEAASLACYALLVEALLFGHKPSFFTLFRNVFASTAIAHVLPGGGAGGAGLGFKLLESEGVTGPSAGFALATAAIGSAISLNVMLWVSLVISIPLAGVHPIYVVAAMVGLLALLAAGALLYMFTKGEEGAVRFVRALGRRLPRLGEERLERLFRQAGASVSKLAGNRPLMRRAVTWAALNWLLDAASLWAFVAAFGHYVDPFELFAAYGIANVIGSIPVTPGGLGIIEALAATLLVGFGVTSNVATLAVLGWRLINFWAPIPIGAACYITLKVPRGAGVKAKRQALSVMAAEAKTQVAEGPLNAVDGSPGPSTVP